MNSKVKKGNKSPYETKLSIYLKVHCGLKNLKIYLWTSLMSAMTFDLQTSFLVLLLKMSKMASTAVR